METVWWELKIVGFDRDLEEWLLQPAKKLWANHFGPLGLTFSNVK